MSEGTKKSRWFQVNLRDVFVATFWFGIACGTGTVAARGFLGEPVAPIWTFVTAFSLLATFWSLGGRYWYVAGTWAYAALFFLFLFWLHKQAILGE
jgi:hypothetical protein